MRRYIFGVIFFLMILVSPTWGARFRRMGNEQFLDICESGSADQVQSALEAGADPDAANRKALTAVMVAGLNNKNPEVMERLVRAGADVNKRIISGGETALMCAAAYNTPEVVEVLLKAGADVNARTEQGTTALMYAAWHSREPKVLELLIDYWAEDTTDNEGRTALMLAARYTRDPEIINTLLDAGAYAKSRDNGGKRAVDYARGNASLQDTKALERLETVSQ